MEFKVQSSKKEEIIDITKLIVNEVFGKKGKAVLVYIPHATCSLIINENADPNVGKDLLDFLRVQIREGVWRHDSVDGNGAAHLKASVLGASVMIPMKDGQLRLGEWQNIFLCEFNGPKERKIIVEVL